MFIKLLNLYLKYSSKTSLKTRFIVILLANSLIPLIIVGVISYYTLNSVQKNKVNIGIQITLDNARTSLATAIDNLGNISKQFAYENTLGLEGGIAGELKKYMDFIDSKNELSDDDLLRLSNFNKNLNRKMSLVNSSNPIIGLISFYEDNEEGRFAVKNMSIGSNADIMSMPAIAKTEEIVYHAPHKTACDANYYVVSVLRKSDIPGIDNIYVYLETNNSWLSNLLNSKQYGMDAFHFLLDKTNRVIFSEAQDLINIGDKFDVKEHAKSNPLNSKYYFFSSASDQGWMLVAAISKSDFNRELVKWIGQIVLLGFFSIVLTVLLTVIIWRSVYRPLRAFSREIKMLSSQKYEPKIRVTRVREFDELLAEFYEMRMHIIELIRQIELKEKRHKELEIEKLLVQINPHFIYNTLNSIQWMARINEQKEIEKMVSIFSRVLNYNLGKKSIIVTFKDELEALAEYMELQKIRYQYQFEMKINVDQSLIDLKVPRFIMQPLVENAIYHGMKDNGAIIGVEINSIDDVFFRISVKDNGEGMTVNEIERLMDVEANSDRRTGLGIGLRYVDGMIKFYYGEQYKIDIESEKGKGTLVTIKLPYKLKEDRDD